MLAPDPLPGDEVVVLDGGLATELESRGHDLSDRLWSARLLRDDPTAIRDVHLAFFRAGAAIATTATYQASFEGFAGVGLSDEESVALLRLGVQLAREAAVMVAEELPDREVPAMVAASVGPYGAARADGSEYSGDYGVSDGVLRSFHARRMEVLASAGADLLAIETIPSEQEVTVLLGLLDEMPSGTRAWLSLTCADFVRTRRGEDASRVFGLTRDSEHLLAVGVNCTAPEHVGNLVSAAVAASGKPAIAYPNSGEIWDAQSRTWGGDGLGVDPGAARNWVAAGARFVGGCCRVGAADIRHLAEGLESA